MRTTEQRDRTQQHHDAGRAEAPTPPLRTQHEHGGHDEDDDAINRLFAPEFRNRLDAIIKFNNLHPDSMGRVVDKFVMELEAQLQDRGVSIELSDEAREWLASHGYQPAYGARPLKRVIQKHLQDSLAELILSGAIKDGTHVPVTASPLGLQIGGHDVEPVRPAKVLLN